MITAKLLEFQKKGITIEKDATNPHYRSSYSSLNEVLSKVKPVLNEMGVVIVQMVEAEGLRTRLIDTDNKILFQTSDIGIQPIDQGYVECFVPFVGATDMQKLGGAITYARRYSLVALLGLEDEDDDGNVASAPSYPKAKAKKEDDITFD